MTGTTRIPVEAGEIVDARRLGGIDEARLQTVLVRTDNMEIAHLVVPAGEIIPTHEAQGEIVLHCLEGRVLVSALGRNTQLNAGQLFYFATNEPFSMQGLERTSLLMTIISPKHGPTIELIGNPTRV